MYAVVFNDWRVIHVPKGEAKFWAILSFDAMNCNVFRLTGSPVPLHISDIV